ncbi:unnamed protein product, partial [Prorocentrum cordatum]
AGWPGPCSPLGRVLPRARRAGVPSAAGGVAQSRASRSARGRCARRPDFFDRNPGNIGTSGESFYLCVFICVSQGPFNFLAPRAESLLFDLTSFAAHDSCRISRAHALKPEDAPPRACGTVADALNNIGHDGSVLRLDLFYWLPWLLPVSPSSLRGDW